MSHVDLRRIVKNLGYCCGVRKSRANVDWASLASLSPPASPKPSRLRVVTTKEGLVAGGGGVSLARVESMV